MPVVVIGLNHRTAPLDLLERLSVAAPKVPKALASLSARPHLSEAVVLSTCNRTEAYVVAERFHPAFTEVRDALADLADLAPEQFSDHLYSHADEGAVEHLFRVAAGLDSAVIGEHEILGQVRTAWETARSEGTVRSTLNLVFRHALEVGKRVRTDTAIGRSTTSVSQAAVALAAETLGSLEDRRVLVLGAGDMGEGMAVAIAGAGPAEMLVASRGGQRSSALAERLGGRSVPLSAVPPALVSVDVLLTCTSADHPVITRDELAEVMAHRAGRPLLVVDVAVPRDVDPAAADLPGVTLFDLDELRRFAARGLAERQGELAAAQTIVRDEVERYLDVASAREAAPLVAALWSSAEAVRSAELDRFRGRLDGLDERQREAVEALTRGIVAKLLHGPTTRIKAAAGTPQGERLAAALRDLLDLA